MDSRISFRLPSADAERLTRLADDNRRSVGAEIRLAIVRHLERAELDRRAALLTDAELDRALLGLEQGASRAA